MDRLVEAIHLARQFHEDQSRLNGDDYIEHSLSVMKILMKYDFDEEILIAAVLHDVCEDTGFLNADMCEKFGDRVGFIVNTLSKNKKPRSDELEKSYDRERDGSYEEFVDYRFLMYVNRFYLGVLADPYILFIKMADQIDNFDTLEVYGPEKRKRKIREIERYFSPIYEKVSSVLTPEYQEKYEGMKEELCEVVARKKRELHIVAEGVGS